MKGNVNSRGRRRRRGKRNRVSRENQLAMIAITIVVCVLFAVLAFRDCQLNMRIRANEARRQDLEQQIEEEKARTEEIEDLRDYMKTDDYIRQAAKDRLGLLEDNEIILKEAK